MDVAGCLRRVVGLPVPPCDQATAVWLAAMPNRTRDEIGRHRFVSCDLFLASTKRRCAGPNLGRSYPVRLIKTLLTVRFFRPHHAVLYSANHASAMDELLDPSDLHRSPPLSAAPIRRRCTPSSSPVVSAPPPDGCIFAKRRTQQLALAPPITAQRRRRSRPAPPDSTKKHISAQKRTPVGSCSKTKNWFQQKNKGFQQINLST